MKLNNSSKQVTVVDKLELADSFVSRAVGLLGRSHLDEGTGLWIRPCSDIHTWFMRFSFDAVFVDSKLVVQSVHPNLKPWKFIWQRNAKSVFELPDGQVKKSNIEVGDQLDVVT